MKLLAKTPRVRIELDRKTLPRGENLSGTVCFEAGDRELWLDRVTLITSGIAKTVGSSHESATLTVVRNAAVPVGGTRRFPLWVSIPVDTELGPKMIMVAVAGEPYLSAAVMFEIEPESLYVGLGQALASATGLELKAWATGKGGEGVFAQLLPRSKEMPIGAVGVGMRLVEGRIQGELIVDAPCPSVAAVLRSMVKPDRRRIPFSCRADAPEAAAGELVTLLTAYARNELQLPVPASGVDHRRGEMPVPICKDLE